jgi:putative ABC transport system permease protein
MLDYLEYAAKSMALRKARAGLTLLGIIIGIAVIVAMISIGQGMQASIQRQLDKMGGDKISIFPPGGFAPQMGTPREFTPFSERELLEIRRIPGVKKAVPHFWKGVILEYRDEKKKVTVMGDNDEGVELWRNTGFYEVDKGRFYRSRETGVVVLGYRAANKLFDREINVGSEVTVNGKKFRVIGVLKEYGDKVGDEGVYLPINVARNLFETPNEITAIFAVAENEGIVEIVAKRIEDDLKKLRGGKDFEVLTTRELADQLSRITRIVTFVLGGIASVSIVVGGVIVMNTMLMAVLERTREVGVMKATGASNLVVMKIFLVESCLVGFMGGVAGILLGAGISKLIHMVGQSYLGAGFMTFISKELVLGVLIFSVGVGSLSGLYPAWRAARLDPVEALRYE